MSPPQPAVSLDAGVPKLAIRPVSVMLFYVGLVGIPWAPEYNIGGRIPTSFAVASLCGLIGWFRMANVTLIRRYLCWAIPLAMWALISTVGTWELWKLSFYFSRNFSIVLVLIIPGLAALLTEERHRRALIGGLAVAVGAYICLGVYRRAMGRSIFDIQDGATSVFLMGMNRNRVVVLVLLTIPFLLAKSGPRFVVKLRWIWIPAAIALAIYSGSRSGLVGLIVAGLTYGLIQRGASRRIRVAYGGAVLVLVAVIAVQEVGGEAAQSSNRLVALIRGERTPGTDARELLLKKAWHVAEDHPFEGVGFGMFRYSYDPEIEGATSLVKAEASNQNGHNTYAQMMAEGGFPAIILFAGMLILLLKRAYARRESLDVRVAFSSFVGVMVTMFFDGLNLLPLFYLPFALLLAVSCEREFASVDRSDLGLRLSSRPT